MRIKAGNKKPGKLRGFTFLEVLIVISIIALLGSIIGVSYVQYLKKARIITAKTQLKNIGVALESYYIDMGSYPTTEQGLSALVQKPGFGMGIENWSGPYLSSRSIPKDPWGNEYQYICPGTNNLDSYDLFSLGKDNTEGGESEDQDITNWGEE